MVADAYHVSQRCPQCGAYLVLRTTKADNNTKVIRCSAYRDCQFTEPYDLHIQGLAEALKQACEELVFLRNTRSSTLMSAGQDLEQKVAALEAENAQLRRERDSLSENLAEAVDRLDDLGDTWIYEEGDDDERCEGTGACQGDEPFDGDLDASRALHQ